jgi:hypothetical protein
MGHAINAQHAKVIDTIDGSLPSGTRIQMELRESNDGKTRFVKVVFGDTNRSYQYTGRNFKFAAQQLSEMRVALVSP